MWKIGLPSEICMQGIAWLWSPALPVSRDCYPARWCCALSGVICVTLGTEIGMKLVNLYLCDILGWDLFVLLTVISYVETSKTCVALLMAVVWGVYVEGWYVNPWFSWPVTEEFCSLELSVLCCGFIGVNFYVSEFQSGREYFHSILLQQGISYRDLTDMILSLPACL